MPPMSMPSITDELEFPIALDQFALNALQIGVRSEARIERLGENSRWASAKTLAWASGIPAALSLSTKFRVSKVTVAMPSV